MRQLLPEQTTGRFIGAVPAEVLPHIEQHLAEYGLPLFREGDSLRLSYSSAEIRLRVVPDRIEVAIAAVNDVHLHQARESATYLLEHIFPESVAAMVWSGRAAANDVPPNFHHATLRRVEQVGTTFLRMHMACDGVEKLSVGGMHFSLLLPPEDRSPVWPRLDAKGRTVWPGGPDMLHRVGYTFVALDPAEGAFSFDIYLHPGSRTSDWARSAQPGAVVGIAGPGGGDFPAGEVIVLAGDETALPAIRRILAQSPADRRGHAVIEVGDPSDRLPLSAPPGIEIRWLIRGQDEPLAAALRGVAFAEPGTSRFFWFAAEQEQVRQAKAEFRAALKLERQECYFSAYWSA